MRIYFTTLLLAASVFVRAQTFDEWFNQKETQLQYLLDQIAANKVYLEYIEKGYDIAKSGLEVIGQIKNGDFVLFRDFINSLSNVKPKIKEYSKVKDIIDLERQILKITDAAIKTLHESKMFSAREIKYNISVLGNLRAGCLKCLDELETLISPSQLQMRDDERIKRIDQLFSEMQEKYGFCRSFTEASSMLAAERLNDQLEVNVSKQLNGLK